MPENRQVQKNAASNQSGINIEETFWRLKINDNWDSHALAQSTLYPDRPGEPDCLYYLRTGMCGYGSNCRYNHPPHLSVGARYVEELPERTGQPDCGYFLKTGTCKYGSTCKYHHPRDRQSAGAGPVSFNVLGLPIRQDQKSCPYYMRTRSCKFGVACKFHHPQPSSLGAASVAGSPALAIIPSPGLLYVGGHSTWSLPRLPYLSGMGLQPYVPAFFPSSQGIMTAKGSNNYMVNFSSTSPTLPERPDQPECRYFMSTGTCKYGSECKFHHPKERVTQSLINPLGLPVRPGQAICSYYRIYGICKYGPTCKFDHPVLAFSQNYDWSPPEHLDASLISNPRGLLNARPPETSPSKLLKLPDKVHKSDSSSDKLQQSDTKTTEESSKQADTTVTTPNSFPASESLQD